jgi:hypothetical protein
MRKLIGYGTSKQWEASHEGIFLWGIIIDPHGIALGNDWDNETKGTSLNAILVIKMQE